MENLFYRSKRPLWVRFFRAIGYFLLFFLSPLCFVVGDILSRVVFTDSGAIKFLSLGLFVVSVTLSLPFAYLLLIHRMRKRLITILHFSLQALLIGTLLLVDSISLRYSGENKFSYRWGNCSTILGGVLRSSPGQRLYQFVIGAFPLTTHYAIDTLEDTCRINLIKGEVERGWCGSTELSTCVGDLLKKIDHEMPMTPGGLVLGGRLRLLLIGREANRLEKAQGQLLPQDHLMLSGKLIETALENMELLLRNTHLVSIAGEERLRGYASLSNEDKAYYEIAIRNQFLSLDGPSFGQALSLMMGSQLHNLSSDINREIAEYVLVSIMDGKLKQDFVEHSESYISTIIGKSLSLIKAEKSIALQDRKTLQKQFEGYRDRLAKLAEY